MKRSPENLREYIFQRKARSSPLFNRGSRDSRKLTDDARKMLSVGDFSNKNTSHLIEEAPYLSWVETNFEGFSSDDDRKEVEKVRRNSVIKNVRRKISSTFQRRSSVTTMSSSKISDSNNNTVQQSVGRKDSFSLTRKNSTVFKDDSKRNSTVKEDSRRNSTLFKGDSRRNSTVAKEDSRKNSISCSDISSSSVETFSTEERASPLRRSRTVSSFCRSNKDYLQVPPVVHGHASIPDIQSRSRANSSQAIRKFNIHLLGSKSTGKTALTVRFLTGRYIHEYKTSPDEVYTRLVKTEEYHADVTISVTDTETLDTERLNLDTNSGIMVLFSMVSSSSFSHAKHILESLAAESIAQNFPVLFVGTQRDLSRVRTVARKEGLAFANKCNCTYFEVSAATDRKVKDCFTSLFRQIEVRQMLKEQEDIGAPCMKPKQTQRNGAVRYGSV